MKIVLFGGIGGIGKEFLKKVLEEGYQVKMLACMFLKVSIILLQLEIVEGDVFNVDDVYWMVEGMDIVVSFFGYVKGFFKWL